MAQQLTFDPSEEGNSPAVAEAEKAALAQGEALAQAELEDRARKFQQADGENEDVALIGGKFKSQDDLLNAYNELQKKLGSKDTEEEEDASEETTEGSEEVEEEETESTQLFSRASDEYDQGGLTDETIEQLASMDSRDLIKAYVEHYSKTSQEAQAQQATAEEMNSVKQMVGGEDAYTEMVSWAGQNLDATEIDAFNNVANSGNVAALRFAVEALNNRFKNAEGYEAPLVTGRRSAPSGPQPYRSQAELARDIANPMYESDPAFRRDVEARLMKSKDLL